MAWCVVGPEINWTLMALAVVVALMLLTATAAIAAEVARESGHDPIAGAVLGVLLGPLAWLLIAALPERRS